DPWPLTQLDEAFGRRLERETHVPRPVGRTRRVHLSADLEHQIVTPLDLLRGVRQAHAIAAYPFDVHRPLPAAHFTARIKLIKRITLSFLVSSFSSFLPVPTFFLSFTTHTPHFHPRLELNYS